MASRRYLEGRNTPLCRGWRLGLCAWTPGDTRKLASAIYSCSESGSLSRPVLSLAVVDVRLPTFFCASFCPFFRHPTLPQGPGNSLPKTPLSGASELLLFGREMGTYSDWVLGRVWTDSPRRKGISFKILRKKPERARGLKRKGQKLPKTLRKKKSSQKIFRKISQKIEDITFTGF